MLLGFVVWNIIQRRRAGRVQEIALSALLDYVQSPSSSVKSAILGASRCVLVTEEGMRYSAHWTGLAAPAAQELWSALRKAEVTIIAERTSSMPQLAVTFIIMMAYLAMVFTMMRRMTGQGGGKGWGDARQKVLESQKSGASTAVASKFEDIAGVDSAKLAVKEVVEMLKAPERYATLGARVPRGVLLVGPPGSGKTLLARACAAEAGVPFLNAAATEFMELFVGRGAARVRQLFDRARKLAPCIVFIDEVDALRARGNDLLRSGGNQEAEQTLNQLLTCMDGLVARGSAPVVVVGATNRPEVLDEALLRPGRFDRVVQVDLPDAFGRYRILRVHLRLKQVPLAADVGDDFLANFATRCDGLAGAALEALVNEAAIRAARRSSSEVGKGDLEEALEDFRSSRPSRPNFPWSLS